MKYLFMLVMFFFLFSNSLFTKPKIIDVNVMELSGKIYVIILYDMDNDNLPDWSYWWHDGTLVKKSRLYLAKESLLSDYKIDDVIKLNLKNQELYIDFLDLQSNYRQKSYEFKIFDLNGRIVEQFKLKNVPGVHVLSEKLLTGIYMVSIIDTDNRSQFVKLFYSN